MPQTILAIDDSPDVHDLLAVRLKPEGVQLHRALSAHEGLDSAASVRPDLILLDVDMPEMSGLEVCQQLKASPATSSIPVIFLTGASNVNTKVQGFDVGAIDYVTKPFEPAELRARVRAALRMKRYQDLLATRANLDALTGLWNRGYFDQRLGEEIAAAARYGRIVSLVMLDVDHFKRINDTHGHPFGDRVLQAIGDCLIENSRTTDVACRYGGEEFAVILTETDRDGAMLGAERLRQGIRALPFTQKSNPVVVTASFGVCCSVDLDPALLSPDTIKKGADDALYRSKQEGRDRVTASSSGLRQAKIDACGMSVGATLSS
jgi:two-component system, cell cycle response regulator